tara:strand:- start:173 stop:451 length:279 start_codon:yes stop_codon:yes gene_type:complete
MAGKKNLKEEALDALIPDDPVDNEERRRLLHFGARFLITAMHFCLFILLLYLLFFNRIPDEARDLCSALVGLFIGSQKEAISYWFNTHAHHK